MVSIFSDAAAVLRARYYFRSALTLGPRVRLWGTPLVSNFGSLYVGDRVRFSSVVSTLEIGVGPNGTLEIGDRVLVNHGTSLAATKLLRIGARCNIGSQVILMDNSFHGIAPDRRDEEPEPQPVVLEDNVWLAARVIVLPGVTVGKNSVVGAGSVVTRDIPPNVLAAGMPAKVIRSLETSERSEGREAAASRAGA